MKNNKFVFTIFFVLMTLYAMPAQAKVEIKKTGYGYGVYDTSSEQWVIGDRFENILSLSQSGSDANYYACRKDSKWGIFLPNGKRCTHFSFDDVATRRIDDMFVVAQDGKYGIVNSQRLMILPIQYEDVRIYSDNEIVVRTGDGQKRTLTKTELLVKKKQAEKSKISYPFDAALDKAILDKLTLPKIIYPETIPTPRVTDRTKTYQVHAVGSLVYGPCTNGYFSVIDKSTGTLLIFDKTGTISGRVSVNAIQSRDVWFSTDHRAIVKLDVGKLGLVDVYGNILKEFKGAYDYAPFIGDMAIYVSEGKNFYIDTEGNPYKHLTREREVSSFIDRLYDISEGKRPVRTDNGWFFVDEAGKILFGGYHSAAEFHEGLAAVAVKDGNYTLWGFVDGSGKFVVEPKFSEKPGDFSDGYARVQKRDGSYCYIDKTGRVCSLDYYRATDFYRGVAFTQKNRDENPYSVNTKFEYLKETLFSCWNSVGVSDKLVSGDVVLKYTGEPILKLSKGSSGIIASSLLSSVSIPPVVLRDEIVPFDNGYINLDGEFVLIFEQSEF